MAKIGDVEVTITDENISRSNEITDRMVEDGTISDNIKSMPNLVNITGVVGKDGWPKLQKLQEYDREGTLFKYVGRTIYDNVAFEKFDTNHPYSARTGFKFTATLKQLRISKAKLVNVAVPKAIKPAVKKTTNAGTQTVKSGPPKRASNRQSVPVAQTEKEKQVFKKYSTPEKHTDRLDRLTNSLINPMGANSKGGMFR